MAETKALLEWRSKQERGEIMEPATFERLVKEAMERYKVSRKRAEKIVGKMYWKTAESKFEKSHTADAIKQNMEKK
jgi:hypothetical protein